ncbi:FAST kinase domain-containing protein 1, mitochondrial-like [Anneissia japonica]|uniref:FAST kinase domain-containing protein 1, mitochondrial-like n=1 Tax=Anneissia japonica TaxID=1529436 RepID=UPI001425BA44|nr:FAST kinase domain-containing protein 1, mitochondrial-like [Anneissia japonica]XP_033099948.1 FAST kinase domain-containing protein 1, mitochondrial-like [Anneissia japonica]
MLCCKRVSFYCYRCALWNPRHQQTIHRKIKHLAVKNLRSSQTFSQQKLTSFGLPTKKPLLNTFKLGSRRFVPWGMLASYSDQIIEEVSTSESLEDILNVAEKRRSSMRSVHIAEVFLQLSKIIELNTGQQPHDLVQNKDFVNLCILAENLVSEMSNTELITILNSLLVLCADQGLSLANVVQSECHHRLHSFNYTQLSYVAVWFHKRKQIRNHTMGKIADIFQKELHKIEDFESFARLIVAVMPICTKTFEKEVLDRAWCLLEETDPKKVPVESVRFILQALVIIRNCHTRILKHCANILLPKLLSVSVTDLSSVHFCMAYLGFSHKELNSSIRARFMQVLPQVNKVKEIICLMDVLGPISSSYVRHQLEEKLLANTDKITAEFIQGACNGLRIMRHNNDSPLIRKITERVKDLISELTIYDLIRICECLKNVDISPADEIFEILKEKLLEILDNAISTSRVKHVAYCFSQLPCTSLDVKVLERLESMWSAYHAGDILQIRKILKTFSEKPSLSGEVMRNLKRLNEKVGSYSCENILNIKSIIYLNQYIDMLVSSRVDPDYLVTAMDQYSNCIVGLSPKMAVQSINRVSKTGYLQRDVLDKAAEVISDNIECIDLNHIISILTPYCIFNYVPASVPTFLDSCAERFMPFLDVVSTDHLLHLAYLLSLSGYFPEPLIRKIFSVEFLMNIDKQLKVSSRKKILNQHRLFCVNRSVALQCPHYEIPWFHQKHCPEFMPSLINENQRHHTIQEIKYFLTELCGGPSYLRTNVLTPYHYNLHFECVLDTDGRVLPCADYGSVLNQCKDMAIGTSHSSKWGVSVKQLPPGAQRVAIEYLFHNQFCLKSHHCKASSIAKRNNLEIIGYKVIQIPYYEWNSKELFEAEDRLSYLQQLLFSDCKPMVKGQLETELEHQPYEEDQLDGLHSEPTKNEVTDNHVLKVLGNMDKWS